MARRIRADQLLFEQGLAASREQAKRLVMAGEVFLFMSGVKGVGMARLHERIDKPGYQLPPTARLVIAAPPRFVSRGGKKLLTAIECFGLKVAGKVCLDAGASTGGFTDCLLQHGAERVYAVDVGRIQLHEKLRSDPRVINLEGVNLRLASPDLLPELVDFVTADLSFISLTVILSILVSLLRIKGELVVLVKPQFELGPGGAPKGIVRDPIRQVEAVEMVSAYASKVLGLNVAGLVPAVIKGHKGNQEFLLWLRKP
ncbi:16S/23S rRNA (cytidine-2'-O)-methyltransferase TlyA [Desulfovibrionales bacterium]